MRSALLLTSERPPSLNDIKVALLTYDTVQLLDPGDRDLFPATGFAMALGVPPLFSTPTQNPVRRIGKAPGFDDEFSSVLERSKSAIRQGTISVVRTFEPPTASSCSIFNPLILPFGPLVFAQLGRSVRGFYRLASKFRCCVLLA
jgi:hypothetical protein